MKHNLLIATLALAGGLALAFSTQAQTIKTWTGGNGDFFDPTHWDLGTVPGATDIALINNGSTATIAATAGTNALGAIRLGDAEGGTESGHIIMNGGHLNLGGTLGDPKAVIGFSDTLSTFIMNGGTIFFDGPDQFPGSTTDDGLNGLDWEVGERGFGRFEMHNNAVFRAGDDLKIAENAAGHGSCLIDGAAWLSVGSGISISGGISDTEQTMVIGGNALVESGNSMGAGNPLGSTDEGYLTMAFGGSRGRLTIQDNAVLNIRRLTAREGTSFITVKNKGQFHIFDVLHGRGLIDTNTPPDRPAETGPNSTYASLAPSDATLTLQDDAQMTVNSDPASGPTKGLAISGPRDTGNAGGTARMIVQDRASFRVEQDLAVGTGAADTSDGTLEVVGPDAKVSVGGNLSLAVDLDGVATPGRATLSAVITGSSHATVNVTGEGRIANGHLKVTLSSYSPVGGESYTLIKATSFNGQLLDMDFTNAPVAAGLSWQVEYRTDSVLLKVAGTPIGPRVITVTTTNNVGVAGQTNLTQAIQMLQNGDTIRFNIPGAGPHYLVTPPFDLAGGTNGYPAITKHNVTIDGYSQPGATPNTNPILAANNAKIKIVLDSRSGGRHMEDIAGYGTSESATLFVVGGTNVTIKGLCFLGPGPGAGDDVDPSNYAISFGLNASFGHVNGCWFGVDLDGRTVYRFKDAVTGFQGPSGLFIDDLAVGVAKSAPDAAAARAQFNVIVGEYIPVIVEGRNTRIAGNFLNVYPDGVTDHNVSSGDISDEHSLEAFIEIGGGTSAGILIGTDGDGLNDAEERNIFGGVTASGDNRLLEWYSGSAPRTNMVIAGNYFGLGVDGVTRFTNSMKVFNGFNSTATVRFGSDFDGVSDAIEGNVISMNYPFDVLFPTPGAPGAPIFGDLSAGARVSLRGNTLVGNNLAPFTYADGSGGRLSNFTNYEAPFMSTSADIIPILSASVFPRLNGTCAAGNPPYTNIIIDVYQLDPEGWENGKLFGLQELISPDGTFTNGFPQGRRYLGSYVDNGPSDSDPAVGKFNLDVSALDLGAGPVTVTANYSADPPGTHNGRTHTSNFSDPITLIPGGADSVKLTHAAPDVAIWYHSTGNYVTNGPVDTAAEAVPLDNWEPYISVMGDSTFLIGFNTFADDQTPPVGAVISGDHETAGNPFQRFAVAFQPAGAGAAKIGEHLFTDAGTPYRGVTNYRRQNGNPQRVAGDKRSGATTFLAASETSIGQNPAFQSDSRWTSNACYNADNAYITVQAFSLDPATLAQTPLHQAFDPLYGNFVTATPPVTQPQVSRTGGRPEALDNGNFVVVSDDRTGYLDSDSELTSFSIITPTGGVVKSATLVDLNDIWDNVAAYRGGFAIRVHNLLYFFDNNGTATHTNDINISSGLTFGTGREDASRIGSDIRSYYVYLAGRTPDTVKSPVSVAIWDSRTGAFVARATVSDTDPSVHTVERVVVAVDALDRCCVAYSLQPTADFTKRQVAARVMKFDGANVSYLTHSFFPFVNYENNPTNLLGLESFHPSVAMTTRQICIAAKGQINSTNNPAGGPNTALQTQVYTVINHPDPQNTPGAALLITSITASGQIVTITWTGGTGPYLLQQKSSLNDPEWQNVLTTPRQTESVALQGGSAFFRVSDNATNTVTAFTAFLSGDGERPQVSTGATALGSFSLDGNTLTYNITFSGLSAPATAAHIHGPTNTTESTGVIVPFTNVPAATSGTISGSALISDTIKVYLLSGLTYANIHDANHSSGEIRGQIGPTQLRAALNGANERPTPVVTQGTGAGTLTRIGNQLLFDITYTGLTSPASAAHIHGRADTTGFASVLMALPTPSGTSGTLAGSLTLDNATLSAIVDGMAYVNIHTSNNPGGEIRGQITP